MDNEKYIAEIKKLIPDAPAALISDILSLVEEVYQDGYNEGAWQAYQDFGEDIYNNWF